MDSKAENKYGHRKIEDVWSAEFSAHPFHPILDRAEGIYLYDTDGNRYIDASGGPMAVGVGHGDKRVNEAIHRQLDKFAFCHPNLSNQPRADLCDRLRRVAPGSLNTTFLSAGGGSDAVESAIKIARAYHLARGDGEKHMIVSMHDSYHGTSLGALSVAGGPGMRKPYDPMLLKWPKLNQYSDWNRPDGISREEHCVNVAEKLEEIIHWIGAQYISAFVATPIGCGADYATVAPPSYWKTIRALCDKYNILLIADEVVTGFGRTGKWFCMEHFDVQADMIIMGKGITSLYAPLGGVIVSDEVNEPFSQGAPFMHGFTNQGHPVSCAACLAVLDILEKDGLVENSAIVGEYLHSQKERLLAHPTVADVRGMGLFMVFEIVANKETMDFFPRGAQAELHFQSTGLEKGIVFYNSLFGSRRPSMEKRGLPMFISPPLCITKEQVDELLDATDATLTTWEEKMGV